MRPRFGGLWRHPDFLKFWAGQSISACGSQVSGLAIPLTAVLVLNADAGQMGLLAAADTAPFLLLGLLVGVWVDRLPRRLTLVATDVARAALLASIPVCALLGVLRMEQLYALGFLLGTLSTVFDVTYQSFLPSLVERGELVEANSKLEVSRSVAQIGGPALAGALVQRVSAPLTITLDALSFLASATFVALVRAPDALMSTNVERQTIQAQVAEGLRAVVGSPLLRSIALCAATLSFFLSMPFAIYVLYVTRDLGITPVVLGMIFSAGSVGALLGALAAGRAPHLLGLGPTVVTALLLGGVGNLFAPLAGSLPAVSVPLLVVGQGIFWFGFVVYNVNQLSLRQAITPDRLQGRTGASMRVLVWGTMPLGSLAGGFLGEAIGLQPTMLVSALGALAAPLWLLFSPVRALRDQPLAQADAPAATAASHGASARPQGTFH